MTTPVPALASRILRWQAQHGRKNLPWQNTRDPYRVWLSEVMLQQTQVSTVAGYFGRFVSQLPDVVSLAAASLDEVLGLWSGLGYYSRARNLHRCAIEVIGSWGGQFPRSASELQTLPGIGRSTAAAIASICFGERVAILDANVKRVVARVTGFDGDLAAVANERWLWDAATSLLPRRDLARTMPRYTQAIMDLGATVCVKRQPLCGHCPLARDCVAARLGTPNAFPVKTRKHQRSAQSIWLLWAHTPDASVWLKRRPAPGVWAGLYCLPWFESREELVSAIRPRDRATLVDQAPFKHVLTHKDLHLHPVTAVLSGASLASDTGQWFAADAWPRLGLPAPVRRLLLQA